MVLAEKRSPSLLPYRSPGSPLGFCWHSGEGLLVTLAPREATTDTSLADRGRIALFLFPMWRLLTPWGGGWSHYNWALVKVLTLHCTSSDTPLQEKVSNVSLLPLPTCLYWHQWDREQGLILPGRNNVPVPDSAFSDTMLAGVFGCLITAWWQWKTKLPFCLCWHGFEVGPVFLLYLPATEWLLFKGFLPC